MKEILAYSNSARPSKAEEGQLFINVRTGETFVFKEDKWHPIEPVIPTSEKTPSTPKEKLVPEPIVETEEPAPVEEKVEEAPKPKKKAPAKKKSTKKETSK